MDFSSALPTFVITLREGVEATLIVGIVLACLGKAQVPKLIPWVFYGVGAGLFGSVVIGLLLGGGIIAIERVNGSYSNILKVGLQTVLELIAIALLSWMLIWMSQQAKSIRSEVEEVVKSALVQSGEWKIFSLVAIAVLQEGFETVIFISAQFQSGLIPVLGAIMGLVGAILIGLLLFKWGVKINLGLFFQIMGSALIIIVAGLVVSVTKHLDQWLSLYSGLHSAGLSLCVYSFQGSCVLGPLVWDLSDFLPDGVFPGIVLKTLLGYREKIYLMQAIAYLFFVLTVGGLYFASLSFKGKRTISQS